jgi:hypothetical protein
MHAARATRIARRPTPSRTQREPQVTRYVVANEQPPYALPLPPLASISLRRLSNRTSPAEASRPEKDHDLVIR